MSVSDYIVIVVFSVGISACIFGVIEGILKGDNDATIEYLMTNIKSLWERIRALGDEIDILRARMTDLETKLKEMEKLDDGK